MARNRPFAGAAMLAVLALLGGCASTDDGSGQPRAGGASAAQPNHRQYFDQRRGRYYYFDQASHRYFWEDGEPRD